MALNVKDQEAVRLAGEVATITGESKTRAIRIALQERLDRLRAEPGHGVSGNRAARLRQTLETEIWPLIPESERGAKLTKAEREEILDYGEGGFSDH